MTDEKKDPVVKQGEQQNQSKPRPVMQEEFSEFKEKVDKGFGTILEKLDALSSQPKITADSSGVKIAKPVVEEGKTDSEVPVSPVWRKLTDEILGPDFRIRLNLPENGGQIFEVYVPQEKSNAGVDHWKSHKQDKRSRELGNTGVKGVKDWLLKIRKNIVASEIKLPYYENPDPRVGIMLR